MEQPKPALSSEILVQSDVLSQLNTFSALQAGDWLIARLIEDSSENGREQIESLWLKFDAAQIAAGYDDDDKGWSKAVGDFHDMMRGEPGELVSTIITNFGLTPHIQTAIEFILHGRSIGATDDVLFAELEKNHHPTTTLLDGDISWQALVEVKQRLWNAETRTFSI